MEPFLLIVKLSDDLESTDGEKVEDALLENNLVVLGVHNLDDSDNGLSGWTATASFLASLPPSSVPLLFFVICDRVMSESAFIGLQTASFFSVEGLDSVGVGGT